MTPQAARQAARLHAEAFEPLSRGWSAEEFVALAAIPMTRIWLEPHALLAARLGPAEAELLTLAVAPSARRAGRARALLTAFEAAASAEVDEAFLEVAEDNAAALTLYTRAGWIEAGRRPGYYRRANGRSDALILRKAL